MKCNAHTFPKEIGSMTIKNNATDFHRHQFGQSLIKREAMSTIYKQSTRYKQDFLSSRQFFKMKYEPEQP